ncbi:hypothetical protein Tco_0738301 [Tanacetum coccineum]
MASSLDEFTVVINLSLHSPPVMGIFNRIHPLSPSSSFSSGILLRIRSVTYLRVIRSREIASVALKQVSGSGKGLDWVKDGLGKRWGVNS